MHKNAHQETVYNYFWEKQTNEIKMKNKLMGQKHILIIE